MLRLLSVRIPTPTLAGGANRAVLAAALHATPQALIPKKKPPSMKRIRKSRIARIAHQMGKRKRVFVPPRPAAEIDYSMITNEHLRLTQDFFSEDLPEKKPVPRPVADARFLQVRRWNTLSRLRTIAVMKAQAAMHESKDEALEALAALSPQLHHIAVNEPDPPPPLNIFPPTDTPPIPGYEPPEENIC